MAHPDRSIEQNRRYEICLYFEFAVHYPQRTRWPEEACAITAGVIDFPEQKEQNDERKNRGAGS